MSKPFEKEIIEALDFGFDLMDHTSKALEDGKGISTVEALGYLPSFAKAPKALTGLTDPINRYRSLPAEARAEVQQFARNRFDLPDDQLEKLIEDTIQEVYGDIQVAQRWGAYIRGRKASSEA